MNILSKTAMAAIAASVMVPVIASPAAAASAPVVEVVYSVDGANVSLGFDIFTEAVNAEVLTDLSLQYVKVNDDNYYTFGDFTEALNAFDSIEESIEALSSSSKDIEVSNLTEGTVDVDSGTVVPVSSEFKVLSIY